MAYTKTQWEARKTVISAQSMNNIEDGIAANEAAIASAAAQREEMRTQARGLEQAVRTVADITAVHPSTQRLDDYATGLSGLGYVYLLNQDGVPVTAPAGSRMYRFWPLASGAVVRFMTLYLLRRQESGYRVDRVIRNLPVNGKPIALEIAFEEETCFGVAAEELYSLRYSFDPIAGIPAGRVMTWQGAPEEDDVISFESGAGVSRTWGIQIDVVKGKPAEDIYADRIESLEDQAGATTAALTAEAARRAALAERMDTALETVSVYPTTGSLQAYSTGLSALGYVYLLNQGGVPVVAPAGSKLRRFWPLGTQSTEHFMTLYLLRRSNGKYIVYDAIRRIPVTGEPVEMQMDFEQDTYFAVAADELYSLRYSFDQIDGIPTGLKVTASGTPDIGDEVSFECDASVSRTWGIQIDIVRPKARGEYARTITVAKDGSGNFAKIADAVADAINASADARVKIAIQPGTYNLLEELGDLTRIASGTKWYEVGIVLPPYVDLIGEGEVKITLLPEVSQISNAGAGLVSAISVRGENKLENLHIAVKNCRYAVHDESSGISRFYHHRRQVKDCTFIHYGNDASITWQSTCAYGCGFGVGDVIEMEGCTFVTHSWDYGALFHDREATNEPTRITLDQCTFVTKSKNNVKFSSTVAKIARHKVLIRHCNVANIDNIEEVVGSGVGLNYDIEVVGEPCTMRMTTASNDTAVLKIRGWQEPVYSTNALEKGKRYVYDGLVSRFAEATGTRFDIIALEDVPANGSGIAFRAGYVPRSLIGLDNLPVGAEVYFSGGRFTAQAEGAPVGRYDGVHTDYVYIYKERRPVAAPEQG